MKKILYACGFFAMLAFYACSNKPGTSSSYTQNDIAKAVNGQNFKLNVQQMQPFSGRSRYVNGNYSLTVTPTQISSYLPYIGRSYTAVYGDDAGINFDSQTFDYQSEVTDKGNWQVKVSLKNDPKVRELYLSIYPDGSADLTVIPINKQTISYTGNIVPLTQ